MDVKQMPVAALVPNDYNFNEMDDGQLKTMTVTIKKQGFIIHPIIVRVNPDGGYVIVDGEHQWRAAQAAGMESVPVQVLTDLSEQAAIAETYRRNGLRGNENRLKLARAINRMKGYDGNILAKDASSHGLYMSNVTAAKMLGKTEGWVRTTLMYAEAANLAAARTGMGFPNESDISKMTEIALKELLETLRRVDPDNALTGANHGDDEDEGDHGQDSHGDTKPDKVTKAIKALAKMQPAERLDVQKTLAKMVKTDAKVAAAKVGENEGDAS